MASPFSVFRKNRKGMLAALTILTMFGFVFIPMCMDRTGSQKLVNPVVVKTTKYGDITVNDLKYMKQQRQRAAQIMQDLAERVAQNNGDYRRAMNLAMQWKNMTDEALVQKFLLSHYAKDHGMVVDNAAINEFLTEVTDDRVNDKEIQTIFAKHDMTDYAAFAALRDELLVDRALMAFVPDVSGTPPAQRFDYYKRLKRRATVELASVPVEGFVEKVEAPAENVLKAFYNEHKDTIQVPTSPEIGFRQPPRVELRYFKADFEKFAANNVTDEEILARYEQNKEMYDGMEKDREKAAREALTPSLPPAEPAETEGNTEKKPAAEGQTPETPSTEPKPADTTPSPETPKDQPATEPPAEESPAAEKPAADAPATEKPAADAPASADSSSSDRKSAFQFVSFLQDATEEPKASAEDKKQDAVTEAPAEEKKGDAATPAEEKKEDAAQTQPTDETKPEAGETKPAPETKSADNEKIDLLKDVVSPQPKGPSEWLKTRIRYELANEKLDKVFRNLQSVLKDYRNAHNKYLEAKKIEGASGLQAPSEPDFQKLAAENGLTFTETKLLPPWELQDLEIARAQFGQQTVLQTVYPAVGSSSAIGLYSMQKAVDMLGDRYFFWKVRETKEETPAFDAPDMQDKVRYAWRFVQARALAKEETKKLAEEATKSGKSLRETFASRSDITLLDPPPFSWMTYGSTTPFTSRTGPRLSEVEGVKTAGKDFMKTVFDLQKGQIGTAMNQPETDDYVIRLVDYDKSDEALWTLFQNDSYDTYASIAQQEQNELVYDWYRSIEKAAGLKWERRPNQPMEESEMPQE